jgi:molecular chaperone Hsp33
MKKKPIVDKELLSHLEKLPEDKREVFLLSDGSVRAVALQGTHTINQMRANHELGILETLVLGHGYLAAGLLASTVKGDDRVQLTIECGGPIKGVYVEAWAIGAVRGYLQEVPIQVDKPLESFDLSPFFGPGFLTVTKLLEGKKTPFSGQIMLQHGSIAKDLAEYFLTSEQTPAVVSLSIQFDREGRVIGSGALFLQNLPGSDNATLEEIEMMATSMPSMGKYLSEGKNSKEFVEEVFAKFSPEYLESQPYGFSCPCDRKRYGEYLQSLPLEERQSILEEGPFPLELQCFNCSTTYSFSKDELQSLLGSL